VLLKLVELRYERNDEELRTGTFRVRGEIVEICPASEDERSLRIEFFGDEIEELFEIESFNRKKPSVNSRISAFIQRVTLLLRAINSNALWLQFEKNSNGV